MMPIAWTFSKVRLNTLTQASKNGRKPLEIIYKRVLCNKHIQHHLLSLVVRRK